jgi:hypothetical protein
MSARPAHPRAARTELRTCGAFGGAERAVLVLPADGNDSRDCYMNRAGFQAVCEDVTGDAWVALVSFNQRVRRCHNTWRVVATLW